MADKPKKGGGCGTSCGCPVPCPGGNSCKCVATEAPRGGASGFLHAEGCPCGDRCSCHPCKCTNAEDRIGSGAGVGVARREV